MICCACSCERSECADRQSPGEVLNKGEVQGAADQAVQLSTLLLPLQTRQQVNYLHTNPSTMSICNSPHAVAAGGEQVLSSKTSCIDQLGCQDFQFWQH